VPETRIRDATPSDLPGIFAIYDEEVLHGTSTFDVTPRTEAQRLEWLEEHAGPRRPVLVATRGEEIVGWASLSAWSERCAYARAAEQSVYVAASARGQGVGRALLQELVRRARVAGIAVLLARIVEGNPASLRLHESVGFGTIGVMHRVGEKLGRILDVRLLELHLDESAAKRPRDGGETGAARETGRREDVGAGATPGR
jgi:phosphinothricin acetyltransferase